LAGIYLRAQHGPRDVVRNFLIQINNRRTRRAHVLTMFAAARFWLAPVLLCAAGAAVAQVPGQARQQALLNMVRQDCGSCHGLTLKGGLGPALTPSALSGKPAVYLKTMILDGRHGSAMPGWRPLLSEPEVEWIVEQLQKGLPDEGTGNRK